jgi:alkylhydroperoxidase family enzyme
MNGCAFCLDMHHRDARTHGESQQRLDVIPAWREVPWFSEQERAALAWTEALTDLSHGHPDDSLYNSVRAHLSEQQLLELSAAIIKINSWNRFVASLHLIPELKS